MNKLGIVKKLLADVGMPSQQQSDLCALTLLGLAGLKPRSPFKRATNEWTRIHDVITFINKHYSVSYAENSRETFRKQAMHHFRNAALVEDNGKATNSSNYRYRLTQEFLNVIRALDTPDAASELQSFVDKHERLIDLYASKKAMPMLPVKINDADYTFSPGAHNRLQKVPFRMVELLPLLLGAMAIRSLRRSSAGSLMDVRS